MRQRWSKLAATTGGDSRRRLPCHRRERLNFWAARVSHSLYETMSRFQHILLQAVWLRRLKPCFAMPKPNDPDDALKSIRLFLDILAFRASITVSRMTATRIDSHDDAQDCRVGG